MEAAMDGPVHRSGFACLIGRPNAGKSTLTNALVGQKVAITSTRPQTTRHTIRGIVHTGDAQLVLVDTPGLHRPRTLLGQRLNDLVMETLHEVDVIGFCVPADQKVGPGDRFIASQLAGLAQGRRAKPVVAIATKADLVDKQRLGEHLLEVSELGEWRDVVPVSAVDGYQVDLLADLLAAPLPEGPPLYPDGELTDEPEAVMVAELVREAALEGVRDELPHSLAVVVEEMVPRPMTMPFWLSRSTYRVAWTSSRSLPSRGIISSTTTAMECGSSSRTPASAASRTSSATMTCSGSSVSSPSG